MSDLQIMRIDFLKQFDKYIREYDANDEIFYDIWLAEGVPDECEEDMFEFIASDEESWLSCVNAFAKCCRAWGIID